MGLLGGILLLGGLGATVIGAIGVVVSLVMWDLPNLFPSVLMLLGGLAAGTIATSILE